jgi:hypothetical protein
VSIGKIVDRCGLRGRDITVSGSLLELTERLDTIPSRFVDDPRWIALLAAVLTVSGPWLLSANPALRK